MSSKNDFSEWFHQSVPWLNMLDFLSLPPFCPRDRCQNLLRHSLESICHQRAGFGAQKIDELAVMIVRIACSPSVRRSVHESLVSSERRAQMEPRQPAGTWSSGEADLSRRDLSSCCPGREDVDPIPHCMKAPQRRWTRATTGDVLVTLTDPTGVIMDGTMHADAFQRILMTRELLATSLIECENCPNMPLGMDPLQRADGIEQGTVLLLREATLLHFAKSGPHLSIHPLNLAHIFLAGASPSTNVSSYLRSKQARTRQLLLDCYVLAGDNSRQNVTKECSLATQVTIPDDDQALLDLIEQEAITFRSPRDPGMQLTGHLQHHRGHAALEAPIQVSERGSTLQPQKPLGQNKLVNSGLQFSAEPLREITNALNVSVQSNVFADNLDSEPSKPGDGPLSETILTNSSEPSPNADELFLQLVQNVDGNTGERAVVAAIQTPTLRGDNSTIVPDDGLQEAAFPGPKKSADELDGLLWALVPEDGANSH